MGSPPSEVVELSGPERPRLAGGTSTLASRLVLTRAEEGVSMAYEGEGAYSALKVAAILSVVLSAVLAIVLWTGANDPRLDVDALGNPTISTEADAIVIAAGVVVLGEGLLLALVLWAIGTIGTHVVALRQQVAPMTETHSATARVTRGFPPAPQMAEESSTSSRIAPATTYSIILNDLGTAAPERVSRLVREYSSGEQDPDPASLRTPDAVIASGLSYAYAEPLRAELAKRGATVEMVEDA
jgi:hypothetical protein